MAADFRVLTPEVFEFALANELKRAVRAQIYLTLLVLQVSWLEVDDQVSGEREQIVGRIARLVAHEVRETDIVAHTPGDQLSIVLLESDFENAVRVVDRIMALLVHYRFPRPIDITVGAACCPTHGADPDSLRRAAVARPLLRRQCSVRGNTAAG